MILIVRPWGAGLGLSLNVCYFLRGVASRFLISIPVVERYPTKFKPARGINPEHSAVAGNSHRDAACASECSGARQKRHTDYRLEGSGFHAAG